MLNRLLMDAQGTGNMGMGGTNIAVTDDGNAIANNLGAMFAHDKGVANLEAGILNPHPNFKNNLNNEDGQNLFPVAPYGNDRNILRFHAIPFG